MNRRDFLAAGLAGVATTSSLAPAGSMAAESQQQLYELREYHLRTGSNKNRVGNFLKDVGIPAMNRLGVNPVGVFTAMYGPSKPTLYVLLAHNSLDSVVHLSSRLMADEEYRDKGADFLNVTSSDPGYVRCESSLMLAFSGMPKLEAPAFKNGIFEMRIYEGHSVRANKKKIEMFNEGGEIAIFKKTGLNPVLFGETIIGPRIPNLTYMLAFKDMADRDAKWQVFGKDPDWRRISQDPAYKDTVSNITDIILRPTSYSQV